LLYTENLVINKVSSSKAISIAVIKLWTDFLPE
jgi:hypothetical protein